MTEHESNGRTLARRGLLGLTAAGSAAVALRAWFGGESSETTRWRPRKSGGREDRLVRDAWQRAHRAGRALLVLVIPNKDEDKHTRGQAWGEFLMHAPPAGLAELAVCEIVCAEMADARMALAGLPGLPSGECAALLIETDMDVARPIEVALETIDSWAIDDEAEYEREIRARIHAIESALRAAIAPDAETLERRARFAANKTGRSFKPTGVDPFASSTHTALDEARRRPALVRLFAERSPARGTEALALLAEVSAEHIQQRAPDGSYWASSNGCGIEVEGRDTAGMGVACGMGHVPEISARFLYFFTEA